ncbi:MAG TPA: hypothetical protein VG711_06585 [Phycisphaerales bacterium]|nr:hypothetical protein [Phycisphaerales bacterium]
MSTISWSDPNKAAVFTSELESRKRIDNQGRICFSGSIDDSRFGLIHLLSVPDSIHDCYKSSIVWKSIVNASKSGSITPKSVLKHLGPAIDELLSMAIQQYSLLSTISVRQHEMEYFRRRLGNIVIRSKIPADRFDRSIIAMRLRHYERGVAVSSYSPIVLRAKGRTDEEAARIALDSMELLRSVWNLFFNRIAIGRYSSNRQRVNKILCGPTHTIHNLSGNSTSTLFSYEEWYADPPQASSLNGKLKELRKFETKVFSKLSRHPYRKTIENWLMRYARALDGINYDTVILQLWGILESMTCTLNQSYDKTIFRAASLWEYNPIHEITLNQIRECRNNIVHKSYSTEIREGEVRMYQIKMYVEQLMEFHIANDFRFKTPEEAIEMLSLPTDKARLRKKQRLISNAIWFRRPTRKRK